MRAATRRGRCLGALLSLGAFAGCGDTVDEQPLAVRGAALARDATVSGSQYNRFACLTCHAERPADVGERILPGAVLQGAARRPSFWSGEVLHLREAVGRCWVHFMRGQDADLDGPTGQALWAWLDALSPAGSTEGTAPLTFTWPRTSRDLGTGGDATRGARVWQRACASCHGTFGAGTGRLAPLASLLPADTLTEHCQGELPVGVESYAAYVRLIVYQKTRHGSFLGYAGSMPPFAQEQLSDADLGDLIALFRCP